MCVCVGGGEALLGERSKPHIDIYPCTYIRIYMTLCTAFDTKFTSATNDPLPIYDRNV